MTAAVQRARFAAWAVLGVLALVQAWMFRHQISPDGVAYLDLSDAVVTGRLGELVNGYWSPAYPFLIGVARLLASPTPLSEPQWQFALIHVVNVLGFALTLAAFEWLLKVLDDAGARWGEGGRHQPFQTVTGRLAAYALFGVGALAMISATGTVPDLLLAAASFATFACALRLHADPSDRASALRLGLVLGGGALTKSFFFPFAAVVLATLAWTLVRRGRSAFLIAAGAFAVVTFPWVIALSISLGHLSTGETGALNYAWYVNGKQPPNTGVMPALAAPAEPMPLDGLAVLPDARGTNPLWYDPTRWHRDVRPTLSVSQQLPRLWLSAQYYAYVGAPFLLALVAIAAASRAADLRTTLERSYVVLLPCLAGIAAYSLVYTTSRYVAPFLVTASVVLAAAFPRDAALSGRRFAVALVLTLIALDLVAPIRGRILINYGLGAFALGALIVRRLRKMDRETEPASIRKALALGVVVTSAIPGLLIAGAALGRSSPGGPHPEWATAQRMMSAGLRPGSKIAVMGNPENSGWARLAGYRIVAVIPGERVAAFKALAPADRSRIIAAFQRAGAADLIEMAVAPVDR